jgi:general secretion pathway protein A
MYEAFYGLGARPFDLTPDPRYLVLTSVHQEALSNLNYAIASRKGVALLIGDAGTGKTTVIRAAIERQPSLTHCVHLHNPALTRTEFVEMLAAKFSLSERARTSKTTLLLELEQLLRRRRDAEETTVLIVDEAQSLPSQLLEEVRLLTNIETNAEKLLSLVIAGQPELADRLNHESLRQLKQRIALRCELRALNEHESAVYVARRITAAGGVPSEVFTLEAVKLIHQYSGGIPRTINVIADNALLGGFAAEQRPVTRLIVHDVCRDFDITRSPFAATAEPPGPAPPRSLSSVSLTEQRVVDAALAAPPRRASGTVASMLDRLHRFSRA